MKFHKQTAILVAALMALAVVPPVVWAQSPDPGLDTITDVIVGRNNKGPYTLSWTNVDPNSIRAVIGGRTLKKGESFNVDTAKGVMSFTSTLLSDAIVRVTYKITPGKSERNSGMLSVPVTLNIFQGQDMSLQVTGLYAQDDPKRPDATKTIVGIGGERKWSSSKLTSQFLVSQRNDLPDDADQGDAWDRSALKVGHETSIGALKFSGSLLRVGEGFVGEKEYGMAKGRHANDFAISFAPNKTVQASATMKTTEETAGKAKGTTTSEQQQNVVVTPNDTTKLSLTHSVKESATAAEGSNRSVDSTQVKLDTKIGTTTNATMIAENAVIEAGDKTDNVKTRQVAVSSKPSDKMSVSASAVQKESDSQGQEQGYNVGVVTNPVNQVKVAVDYAALENQVVGQQTKTGTQFTLKPVEQVAITASHTSVDSSKLGQVTDTNVSLNANPLRNTQLTGSIVSKTVNENEQFQRNFSLTSTPTAYAKISASFSHRGVNENDDVTKAAGLELTPFVHTRVSAGFRYIENGASVMTIRDYAATSKPLSYFSVTGSIRDRDTERNDAPDTAAMQVALAPTSFFSLTGGYQSNPENDKGQIQTYKSTTAGMNLKVGSVGVTAGFSEKDEYMLNRLSEERNIGLNLPAFGEGQLNTGLKVSKLLDGSESSMNTFLLGYKHNAKSGLTFSLTGYYTKYVRDRMAMPERNEYSAEASLGVKF